MKKYISMLCFGALLAACSSGEYEDWAAPQSHAQEAAQSVDFAARAVAPVDFNTLTADSVQLFAHTATAASPITSEVLSITLYNADRSASNTLRADVRGRVKAAELQTAVQALYGMGGDLRRIPAMVCDTLRIGNAGFVRTAEIAAEVTLVAPEFGEFLYEIGDESGWAASHALRSPALDGRYEGWYYLNGAFKFKPNADNYDGDYEYSGAGRLTRDGKDNIPDPGAGFYRINVDLNNFSYTLEPVSSLSLIGTAVGSWETDVDMSYNVQEGCWEYTGELQAGAFKIRLNHAWTTAWGSASGAGGTALLTYHNGTDIQVAAAGRYTVKFYLSYEGNNRLLLTAQ